MKPQPEIIGRAYLARSSRRVDATLRILDDRLVLVGRDDALLAEGTRGSVRFDPPVGQVARKLTLADGTVFETNDQDGFEALAQSRKAHLLHRLEAFSPRLLVVLAASIAGVLAVWMLALPALVWLAVQMTPDGLRTMMDRGILQSIDLSVAQPTATLLQDRQRAETVLANLVAALPPEDATGNEFRLYFRDMPGLGPNAVALPGGTIIVTDEMLTEFGDPDILAGVFGHEIGHVVEAHGITQLYRSLGIHLLVALIAGDTGPIVEDIVFEGNVLLSLSYSRDNESAADAFGLRLTERAGYDPAGLLQFFRALPDSERTESGWGETHPATGARIQEIEEYLAGRST